MRFEKFERKMDYVEGRVESYDLGRTRDLRDEFADLENDEDLENQLAELKKKVAGQEA